MQIRDQTRYTPGDRVLSTMSVVKRFLKPKCAITQFSALCTVLPRLRCHIFYTVPHANGACVSASLDSLHMVPWRAG